MFRPFALLMVAASALATPVAAQAPAPTTTAFDGKYVGTATVGRGRATTTCWAINSINMTISSGQVVIHANRPTGDEPTLRVASILREKYWPPSKSGPNFCPCLERSMTRYSQVSAWSLNAIGASRWPLCPLRRCRSMVTISGYRENHRIRRLPRAPSVCQGAFRQL
jgi:hypothetical protein